MDVDGISKLSDQIRKINGFLKSSLQLKDALSNPIARFLGAIQNIKQEATYASTVKEHTREELISAIAVGVSHTNLIPAPGEQAFIDKGINDLITHINPTEVSQNQ